MSDFSIQFIKLLYLKVFIMAFQAAAPSTLRLLRTHQILSTFFGVQTWIWSRLWFLPKPMMFPFVVNIDTPFVVPSD